MDAGLVLEDPRVQPHVPRLALVVEFLAQPVGDFVVDLAGIDGLVGAAIDRENQFELGEIGFDRRLHVGVLQLAGERAPLQIGGAMDLAERGGAFGLAAK